MTNRVALFREISKLIKGFVLDSGDPGYADTCAIDNGRVNHEPLLVVRPINTLDVAAVVKYCVKNGIKFTVKSGGHGANGYCLNSIGIVIDLVHMNTIRYSGKHNIVVGAGTRWISIYDFLRERQDSRIVVGGGCPSVGVGGFLLGGGYSFLSRSLGLGSDNINSMEFVDADGDVHTVNSQSEPDLFWALRGGGGGNFGIVTKFNIKLRTVHKPLMVGQIAFPFHRVDEILTFYDRWSQTLPDTMAVYGMLRNFPDPRRLGEPILSVRFTPVFNGPYEEGIDKLRPLLELKPITSEFHAMTLPEWEQYIGSATLVDGRSAYIRSLVFQKAKMHEAAPTFREHMPTRPTAESYIVWTHLGGEVDNSDSAYAHRGASAVVEVKSLWPSAEPHLARPNVEWAHRFFDALEEFSSGAYLNYIDPLLADWQTKYYGDAGWRKLTKLKSTWDKHGVFDFQQGIGSTYTPDTNYPLDLSPLDITI